MPCERPGVRLNYVERYDPALFAESIGVLLNDLKLRARMGDVGFSRVFDGADWDRSKVNLIQRYNRLLSSRPKHSCT